MQILGLTVSKSHTIWPKNEPHIRAFVRASFELLSVGQMLKCRKEIFEGQRATKMDIFEAIRSTSSEYCQKSRIKDPLNNILNTKI